MLYMCTSQRTKDKKTKKGKQRRSLWWTGCKTLLIRPQRRIAPGALLEFSKPSLGIKGWRNTGLFSRTSSKTASTARPDRAPERKDSRKMDTLMLSAEPLQVHRRQYSLGLCAQVFTERLSFVPLLSLKLSLSVTL